MRYIRILVFFILLSAGCSSITPLSETLITPERGIFQVGFRELEWTDSVRNRTIKAALWYPSHEPSKNIKYLAFEGFAAKDSSILKGQYPLIMVSHGTGGHRFNQFFMAEFLASFGYIVAAVEHPHNNSFDNKDQGKVANLWNRPKDISFIISRLIDVSDFSSYIDNEKIGFIGHSIGGYTGFVLAGATPDFQLVIKYCSQHSDDKLMCDTLASEQENETNYSLDFLKLSDQRIKALFLMAPALGQAFNSENMKNVSLPILLVASGQDEVLTKPFNIARYRRALRGKAQYIEFPNAGHYAYIHECPFIVNLIAGEACVDIGTPRKKIHPELRKLSLSFFNRRLKRLK